jgi:signal transduction histidine kinase
VEDALPLSAEGLTAVQNKQNWWERASISGEEMLIYSHPLVQEGETIYIVQVARSLTERNRTLKSLATTLGGAGLLTILLAFGAGWTLSGYSLRPIHRITQTAQTIGEERDFTRRVAYNGPQDEVGRLASTFNQMLAGLQEAYQKVEHSLEMQRNFVADVSHELRTPLTTLRGNLGLLARTPPPEEQVDILADMVDESDRLIRLVQELLLLARADAGRSLAKEPLALQPVLEETMRQAGQLDPARNLSLEIEDGLMVTVDRDALKQVMLILVDNALKHSEGDIQVIATQAGPQVEIQVRDHGPGIPADKLARLFDRFYRGDEIPVTPGFGLGLPIAKALVEGMGGAILVESEEGTGSVVRLQLTRTAESVG